MKMLSIKTQTSPAVVSGGYYFQSFGEFEKVTAAIVQGDFGAGITVGPGSSLNAPALSGYIVQAQPQIVSGNQVMVQFTKLPGGSGAYVLTSGVTAVVASGDLISNTITTLAAGE